MEHKTEKIVAAAQALVIQHGYRKVTMSDLAEAVGISRPTLYAEFANKDAVMEAVVRSHIAECDAVMAAKLPRARTLKARLALVLDVWIVAPFESVIDTANGFDLMGNIATYAPAAIAASYQRLEQHLAAVLEPEMPGKRAVSARDLAHILMLATRGLKASTTSAAEMRRLVDGLIAMTIATAEAG